MKEKIQHAIAKVLKELYGIENTDLEVQQNKTNFGGDFTVVIFPLVKQLKKNPVDLGTEIGKVLTNSIEDFESFEVVKGFLNLSLKNKTFLKYLKENEDSLGVLSKKKETVLVEYSSPNTNKPLHLGHVRNNLLGFSVAEILKAAGYGVIKTQIINDRGIHICKSMVAWQKFGNGATPESTGLKGDKLVGNYYVKFDQVYKKEIAELTAKGVEENQAKKEAPIMLEAQEMLVKWEHQDPEVRKLWNMMNSWVYKGFDETYHRMGVDFDQRQHESQTYLLGKGLVEKGLEKGIFYKKEDGSVWVDLTDEGLDQKLLLRADGTSVYMTQDLGTAVKRFEENDIQRAIYTVGNEQDYHFQVLFKVMKKLSYPWANEMYHLSYGMVELPNGKMKSREGTVVDADDLMQEMYLTAKEKAQELGKLENISEAQKEKSYEIVGMGALKYFILKIDPKKKILFNPAESIDFNGNTGPFIQYTYARIQSLLVKAGFTESPIEGDYVLNDSEKDVILMISQFNEAIEKAAAALSPALIANYIYDLVKSYNSFYQTNQIIQDDLAIQNFRLELSKITGEVIQKGLKLLGISTVDRM